MEHWYVYYKLPVADLGERLPAVRALLAAVQNNTGARPQLQTRIDTPDGMATVMEIYADIDDPARFGPALEAALAASQLPPALRSSRRTERFRDL